MSFRQSFDYAPCSENTAFDFDFSSPFSNGCCFSCTSTTPLQAPLTSSSSCTSICNNPKVKTVYNNQEANLYSRLVGHSPSTLPTPPHSPPSSESDLDTIIASIPEILECPPSTLFPGVEDVLLELENIKNYNSFQDIKPYSTTELTGSSGIEEVSVVDSKPSLSTEYSFSNMHPSKLLWKDSMWGAGQNFSQEINEKVKVRTLSESSDEHNHHSLFPVYSDEEYNYLPDTPCVSDEDDKSDNRFGQFSPAHSNASSSSAFSGFILSPKSVVNREHNYCGKSPSLKKLFSDSGI